MSLAFLDFTPIVEIKLGQLAVSPHGIGTAVGFLAGAKLLLGATRRLGIPDGYIHTALTRAIIAALVGARLAYVLNHLGNFRDRPLEAVRVWEGGASLLGGITAAMAVALPYLYRRGHQLWPFMDTAVPGIALGIAIGRVGDLVVADHLGKPTDFFLGYRCTGVDTSSPCVAPIGQAVHQPALYDLISVLTLLGLMLWLRRRALRTGTLFLVFVAWYGTGRVVEDFFRIDETHGLGLTASQWFSAAAVLIAIGMLVAHRRDWTGQSLPTTGADVSAEPVRDP
ncbi:MAG: prolipoprotein diacylglyceryl transferase [Actinomycetota bacterium]|nr:prolipoprotein diacylglyceryl transferase [Actinomycetota bacterium]